MWWIETGLVIERCDMCSVYDLIKDCEKKWKNNFVLKKHFGHTGAGTSATLVAVKSTYHYAINVSVACEFVWSCLTELASSI